VLTGATSCAALHEFGVDRRSGRARFLDLANGIPCADTLRRVRARRDPAAVEKALLAWMQAVQEITETRRIAIAGTTVRGSSNRQGGKAAIPMVSAWARQKR
jgi:DDE_Tnp_1-associated